MAGNSTRRGAVRTPGSKKGASVGTGGKNRRALEGRGPTPPATERTGHPAARRANAAARREEDGGRPGAESRTGGGPRGSGGLRSSGGPRSSGAPRSTGGPRGASGGQRGPRAGSGAGRDGGERRSSAPQRTRRPTRPAKASSEAVAGRNSVVEALRADVPASALYVATRIDTDDRVREALRAATQRGLPVLETTKGDLDRLADGAVHQGLVLQVPPYAHASLDDLLTAAVESGTPALVVALDGVTDPRNLGAVVRSVAAFGGHGVLVPERRSAGMTASAWKTSAGAAARVPVARETNLTRALEAAQAAGCFVIGLDADADAELSSAQVAAVADGPVVLVVGSEGNGLSRLVRTTCDLVASIPMAGPVESLNAGVAAGVALYEVARVRAQGAAG